MSLFEQLHQSSKKLVLVLTTSASVPGANKKDEIVLVKVSYIHYLLCFHKDKKSKVRALINYNKKVNAITSTYASKSSLKVCQTNVNAKKIDGYNIKTFEIILVNFQIEISSEGRDVSENIFIG